MTTRPLVPLVGFAAACILACGLPGTAYADATGSISLSGFGTPPQANYVECDYSWSGCTGAVTCEVKLFKGTVNNKEAAVEVATGGASPIGESGNGHTEWRGGGVAKKFMTGDTVFARLRILNNTGAAIITKYSTDFTVP